MRFLTLCLILSSFFLSDTFATNPARLDEKVEKKTVLGVAYNSMLYKTSISFREYAFSGLVLFKKQEMDSSTHIVFMSEFGMTMLDIKYKNDQFEVVSAKEFFSHPKLLEVIFDDFRILLQDLDRVEKARFSTTCKEKTNKLKFRHFSDTFIYLYQSDFLVKQAKWRKNMLRVVKVQFERNAAGQPQTMNFIHRGVSLVVNMELLNLKE